MYVLIVSIICALMLGGVHYLTFEAWPETILVTFLLFVAIDSGLRAIMGRPSWAVRIKEKSKKEKKK